MRFRLLVFFGICLLLIGLQIRQHQGSHSAQLSNKVSLPNLHSYQGWGVNQLNQGSWQTTTASRDWQSPWVTPNHTFNELIPSWTGNTKTTGRITILVRTKTNTSISSWDAIANWARLTGKFNRKSGLSQPDDQGSVVVDTWQSQPGTSLRSWQLKIRLYGDATLTSAGAVASQIGDLPATSKSLGIASRLKVPQFSQMIHQGHFPEFGGGGTAWCSPTSLAMVLAYYQALPKPAATAWVGAGHKDPVVDHLASLTYDYRYQGNGNWGFNTAYAGTRGLKSSLTRLTSLRQAERFLAVGIPLIASISFPAGELAGAPISQTAGHLLVIVGFTETGDVLVNDPAAKFNSSVPRTYRRSEFEKAWLRKSHGLVYLIRDESHPLPKRPSGVNNW